MNTIKSFLSITIIFCLLFFSCSKDDNDDSISRELAEEMECDEAIAEAIAAGSGTVCCALGSFQASAGETLQYTFKTTIDSPVLAWSVVSGDIAIINGQDTNEVTVVFGEFFERGRLQCSGKNEGITCSSFIDITKK